jgi:hypothetical protein
VLRALRGERILTTKDTKVSKEDKTTRAKTWFDKLTTLSSVEGKNAPRAKAAEADI